jgi:hypothetical protein
MKANTSKKGALTHIWFDNLSFVTRQGSLLWGLPFSFNQSTKTFSITYRGELKSKCFMTFFTFWILIYSSNYVYIAYFRSKDLMNGYEFCFCITFGDLVICFLALVIFLDVHHYCWLCNAGIEYGRKFNCKLCVYINEYIIMYIYIIVQVWGFSVYMAFNYIRFSAMETEFRR